MIRLTPELLARATGCTTERAVVYAPHLASGCGYYGISASVQRLAAFLAQVGHESQGFAASVESLNYSVDGLLATFSRARISEADARALGRADGRPADQVAIANTVYGGEWGRVNLGNTEPGDGWRYRGRGPTQLTGRANYARLRDRLRARLGRPVPDFEAEPQALEQPEWGSWAACDFWDMRGLNALADADHFALITRRINGGTNGMEDRQRRWELARRVLAEARTAPAPVEDRSTPVAAPAAAPHAQPAQPTHTPAVPAQEQTMPLPAILQAVLPTLVGKIPELVALSNARGDERKERALQLAAEVAVQAVAAPNLQAAVEAMEASPAAADKARQAVRERWFEIQEAGGGGIDGARRFLAEQGSGPSASIMWATIRVVTFVALGFLGLANLLAATSWGVAMWRGAGVDSATQFMSQVITADIAAAIAAISFWLGSSLGSRTKDEAKPAQP